MSFGEITLTGRHVRLEPLRASHAPALLEGLATPEDWTHYAYERIADLADAEAFIDAAMRSAADGTEHPFAIVQLASGKVAGTTRFKDLRAPHFGLEIGSTWVGMAFQRTPVNTECKLLMLTHAFEAMEMQRVQFRTDVRNQVSQRALERLGAVREAVLRGYAYGPLPGEMRDLMMYSITASEWPAVRDRLQAKLDEPRNQ